MNEEFLFSSYKQAYEYLKINPKVFHFKIEDHYRSENKITHNNNLIYAMGIGPTIYPGYPKFNHLEISQKPILDKLENDGYVNVFRKLSSGYVMYLGKYRFYDYKKKLAPNGFVYFQFVLKKIKYNL